MTKQELQNLTIEELFQLNKPMVEKIYLKRAMTAEEHALHAMIVAVAEEKRVALRKSEMAERVACFQAR